jgi:3-oxoacyl-[acyl-carrier-protein] synthase-3
MGTRIAGIGKYLPARVVTNADLAGELDTSDEWITSRTGIKERRFSAPDETSATMGLEAARRALDCAGLTGGDIDLVICATCTPDNLIGAISSLIQNGVGADRAGAFDINAACAGFVTSLATAAALIESGVNKRVLIVASEAMTRVVDKTDRGTAVLFGDAAAAVVLEQGPGKGVHGAVLHSDGGKSGILYSKSPAGVDEGDYFLKMEGREVFMAAVSEMELCATAALEKAGRQASDVDLMVPHQANQRIIDSTASVLDLPKERVFLNLERYGNTSGASIPLALCEAWESGQVKNGDLLLLVAVGAGIAAGACLLEWDGPEPPGV